MPILNSISYIIDGEDIFPAITNRPIIDVANNVDILNSYINNITTYNSGDGSLSIMHDGGDAITTSDTGIGFNNFPLKNLGAPVDDDDAMTKSAAEALISTATDAHIDLGSLVSGTHDLDMSQYKFFEMTYAGAGAAITLQPTNLPVGYRANLTVLINDIPKDGSLINFTSNVNGFEGANNVEVITNYYSGWLTFTGTLTNNHGIAVVDTDKLIIPHVESSTVVLRQYTMTNPDSIFTATSDSLFLDISARTTTPQSICVAGKDGELDWWIYVLEGEGPNVYSVWHSTTGSDLDQFSFIQTVTLENTSTIGTARGIWVNDTARRMYILTDDTIHQYNRTPTGANERVGSFDLSRFMDRIGETTINDITMSEDGRRIYLVTGAYKLVQFELTSPFEVSSITGRGTWTDYNGTYTQTSVCIRDDDDKIYMLEAGNGGAIRGIQVDYNKSALIELKQISDTKLYVKNTYSGVV